MKLYLAGIYTAAFNIGGNLWNRLTENEKYQRSSVKHYLESYHYIHKQSFIDKIRKDGKQVFLDSGAFSAFTKGVNVDIDAYCRYIQDNDDIILRDGDTLLASVLDGIGDPLKTWQNQRRMEQLGVKPLPCFHYGEDERYLEWYIQNYDYITLGGMVPISTPQLRLWLDRLWEKYLTDASGRPRLKVHGFGLTTISLMERYPWYSVDSSSWVQIAKSGGIVVPPKYRVLSVSDQSPSRKMEGQHLTTLPEIQQKAIIKELEETGLDVQRAQETYLARWVYNMYAFGQLGERISKMNHTFKADQMGLF